MSKFIFLISLVIMAALPYLITSFEFILIAIFALAAIFLIIVAIISILRKLKFSYIKTPLLIMAICFLGMIISLFRPYEKAVSKDGSVSDKLKYAYETDQDDRKQLTIVFQLF